MRISSCFDWFSSSAVFQIKTICDQIDIYCFCEKDTDRSKSIRENNSWTLYVDVSSSGLDKTKSVKEILDNTKNLIFCLFLRFHHIWSRKSPNHDWTAQNYSFWKRFTCNCWHNFSSLHTHAHNKLFNLKTTSDDNKFMILSFKINLQLLKTYKRWTLSSTCLKISSTAVWVFKVTVVQIVWTCSYYFSTPFFMFWKRQFFRFWLISLHLWIDFSIINIVVFFLARFS